MDDGKDIGAIPIDPGRTRKSEGPKRKRNSRLRGFDRGRKMGHMADKAWRHGVLVSMVERNEISIPEAETDFDFEDEDWG